MALRPMASLTTRKKVKSCTMFMYKKTAVATFSARPKLQMSLCTSLNSMRTRGRYCDLELIVSGKSYPIHKLVLAASSLYFDKMLSSNFLEKYSKSVDLTDVFPNGQTLMDILDYIYTGCIQINEENYRDILNGASHFLIEDLRRHCSHYMLVNLSPVNALQHWALAEMYSLNDLAEICFRMVRARFHDFLLLREDPLHMPVSNLKQLITQGALTFLYKFEKLKFLLSWLTADLDGRKIAMRTLLEDREFLEGLGLTEILQKDLDPENILEVLRDLVDQQEEKLPRFDDKTEALVAWSYKSHSERNTRILTVCAYIPATNRWCTINKIRVNRHFGPLIGFINRQAVYKTMNGFLIVDLNDYTYERVGIPTLQSTSGLRTHHIFLFDDRVFCLMEVSKYTKRTIPDGSQYLYPEAKGFLKVYSTETKQWSKVCDIPVPLQLAWIPMQYHIIQRDDYSCCFIIAMSNVHSFQIRGPEDHWRINGPFLFMLKKKRTKYAMVKLSDPPVDHEIVPEIYSHLQITGSKDKLYVYGSNHEGGQDKEVMKGLMAYEIEKDRWEDLGERVVEFPTRPLVRLSGFNPTGVKVGSVATGGVQSLGLGRVYHLHYHCPFVAQFWAADLESGESDLESGNEDGAANVESGAVVDLESRVGAADLESRVGAADLESGVGAANMGSGNVSSLESRNTAGAANFESHNASNLERCNRMNLENPKVIELTPPPLEKLKMFTVCRVPFSVLDGASTQYSDRFERRVKSPMAEARLEGGVDWDCILEPKLEPSTSSVDVSSNSESTASSSSVSSAASDVEIIDVEN